MAVSPASPLTLSSLQKLSSGELLARARSLSAELHANLEHGELVAVVLQQELNLGHEVRAEGVLEVLPEGFAFLRSPDHDYRPGPDDVFVSPSQVRNQNLKTGHRIAGPLRGPRGNERFFALLQIDRVNDGDAEQLAARVTFAARQAIVATRRLPIAATTLELKALRWLSPWCFGHRALLTTPPDWPRPALLGRLATALRGASADPWLLVCLLDQRPEDVAAQRQQLAALSRCEVLATTFDELPERHVATAELLLARARHEVEAGADVVLLFDSLTALARASHLAQPPSGRWLCPGLDAMALQSGKSLFAAARATAEGGSLTVIATACGGAPSPADEAIRAEFAHRGNSDVVIRSGADPAMPFDVEATRTRTEDDVRSPAERLVVQAARAKLQRLPANELATAMAKLVALD